MACQKSQTSWILSSRPLLQIALKSMLAGFNSWHPKVRLLRVELAALEAQDSEKTNSTAGMTIRSVASGLPSFSCTTYMQPETGLMTFTDGPRSCFQVQGVKVLLGDQGAEGGMPQKLVTITIKFVELYSSYRTPQRSALFLAFVGALCSSECRFCTRTWFRSRWLKANRNIQFGRALGKSLTSLSVETGFFKHTEFWCRLLSTQKAQELPTAVLLLCLLAEFEIPRITCTEEAACYSWTSREALHVLQLTMDLNTTCFRSICGATSFCSFGRFSNLPNNSWGA